MDDWNHMVNKQIEEAMEKGMFSDLPGKGKPIRWDDNPFADPEAEAAHALLKNAGYTLPWIAERQEIDADLDAARKALARSWRWCGMASGADGANHGEWQLALQRFRERVVEINQRIRLHNLKVPREGFQRLPVDAEREIETLTGVAS